jgi:hypothetical protein
MNDHKGTSLAYYLLDYMVCSKLGIMAFYNTLWITFYFYVYYYNYLIKFSNLKSIIVYKIILNKALNKFIKNSLKMSYGWLTESSLLPKKSKDIKIDNSSVTVLLIS